MDRYYSIEAGEPNDVSTPNDGAASTSSSITQETGLVDHPEDHPDQLTQEASTGNFTFQPMETVRLRRIETMAEETLAIRLARIEAHIEGCILQGYYCEYWSELHETKLTWATNRISEATKERDELTRKVEELSNLVLELTICLNQGESRIQSVERVCTVRASDFHTQLYRIHGTMDNQSTSTINPESTPHEPASLDIREPVHPSVVRREGSPTQPEG